MYHQLLSKSNKEIANQLTSDYGCLACHLALFAVTCTAYGHCRLPACVAFLVALDLWLQQVQNLTVISQLTCTITLQKTHIWDVSHMQMVQNPGDDSLSNTTIAPNTSVNIVHLLASLLLDHKGIVEAIYKWCCWAGCKSWYCNPRWRMQCAAIHALLIRQTCFWVCITKKLIAILHHSFHET